MAAPISGPTRLHHSVCGLALMTATLLSPLPALAQVDPHTDPASLIADLQEQLRVQEDRLEKLEQILAQSAPARIDPVAMAPTGAPVSLTGGQNPTASRNLQDALKLSGDMRLRYEHNSNGNGARNDSRGVVRGRIAAIYDAAPGLQLGARLVTGNPDDPNSADVSFSDFANDLQVSLDQLYGIRTFGKIAIMGGKFANPFRRTDLVWDGDVNPQGVAMRYAALKTGSTQIGGSALFFPIERSVAGPDSSVMGFQATLDHDIDAAVRLGLAVGYYDYEIKATETADAGDFRTNLIDSSGAYVSDFDLLDVVADAKFNGLGKRWPLGIQAEYVHNFGADNYNSGYSASALIGHTKDAGDYSFGYAYHVAEADSVFGAFAQDNIPYASNYEQHSYSVSYALSNLLQLDATLYAFRVKDAALTPITTADWEQRLRLNLVASF